MSNNFRFRNCLVFLLCGMLTSAAFSKEFVELPAEELAKESVYPIFDRPTSVMNRNVVTEDKMDLNLFYGYAMTEPISNVNKFGLGLYYHKNEDHAFGLLVTKNSTGLSDYANQLNKQFSLDFSRAPSQDMTYMFDYMMKAFYGKLSISKSLTFNTSLYGSASAGFIKYTHKTYPGIALGMGQKFYFGKKWALRADLRLYAHQAPIPFLAGNPGIGSGTSVPSPNSFSERLTFTTNLDVGLSYLF